MTLEELQEAIREREGWITSYERQISYYQERIRNTMEEIAEIRTEARHLKLKRAGQIELSLEPPGVPIS